MTVSRPSRNTPTFSRRRFVLTATGAAATAILAACGGGSATPSAAPLASTRPAQPTGAPAATAPPSVASAVAPTSAASATTAVAASAAASTAPASSSAAGAAQKVSVMLDWVPNTNHTGLYVAQERGYFKEQGLIVDILPLAEGSSVEQVVGNGKVQFGISSSEPLAKARSEGIPIVSIAAIIQHDTSGFASLKKANITRPKDFEGKRYASFGSPTEKALITKLMSADGGDASKVEFVETGDADFLTLAQKGQVDFAWVFEGWEVIDGRLRGLDLNYLPLTAWQQVIPDYYTPIFITNDDTVQKRGAVVKQFLAAISRGYNDAIADPKGTGDILAKATPETSKELIQQSQVYLAKQYKADATRWGDQKAATWQTFGAFMTTEKLLDKPFDPAKAFTTQFLP